MDHKSSKPAQRSRDNDARVVRTRAALHHALLILAERMPFADITVRAIAEQAGIGYATFFRHYPDKQSLLAAIAAELVDELVAEMGVSAITDPELGGRKLAQFVEERRGICHALLVGAGNEIRRAITGRAIEAARAQALPHPAGFPEELIVSHTVAASLTLMAWWLEHPGAMDRDRLAEALNRLALAPTAALRMGAPPSAARSDQ